jgi:GNAT superfamily N-acetyltransferase
MNESLVPEPLPDGYPAELQRWVTVSDGRRIFVRPVVTTDSGTLLRELESADQETIYQRFFRSPIRLDAAQLDRLTRLDYRSRLALAAFDEEGTGLAIARYETIEPGVAEIAVVVKREWRGLGVASVLLGLLEQAAASRDITLLTALYLPSNEAIAGVLERRGFTVGLDDSGVAGAEKRLTALIA